MALMKRLSQFITLLNIPFTIQFAGGRRDGKLAERAWRINCYKLFRRECKKALCLEFAIHKRSTALFSVVKIKV